MTVGALTISFSPLWLINHIFESLFILLKHYDLMSDLLSTDSDDHVISFIIKQELRPI